jgi:hypothetical protein
MTSRDTRREENQRLFRIGNERLQLAVDDRVADDDPVPFLCECADEFCDARVTLTLEEWRRVAGAHNHFVMVSGHPQSEGEKVVGALEGYDVVKKPD